MMMENDDFRAIAGYAAQAPSGHNTQPWKFRICGGGITVIPDFSVALPVVDSDNRELYISLGCAVENLFLAARHFGYAPVIRECGAEKIVVALTKDPATAEDRLFSQIEKRQTNRSVYNGNKIPPETLERLETVRREEGVRFYLAETGTSLAGLLAKYIAEGNEIQMNDAAFKEELLSWMRFNAGQVKRMQDGLSHKVFGNPPLPKAVARAVVARFLKAARQNRSDMSKIASSSHLVLFTVRTDTVEEWIGSGRTLQRFLLTVAASGIACAFMNQPCEVGKLAAGLQAALPGGKEYPVLILRIGYAGPVPYSPRKEIGKLLV